MSQYTAETYSAKQLSPFTGNVQIINTAFARALSLDGNTWQIQTICESHQQQWNINSNTPRRFIIYGTWDKHNQLSRHPIDPMLDVPDESIIRKYLIHAISINLHKLPFKPKDSYECWLLERETGLPLTLLATSIDENLITEYARPHHWRSRSGNETEFTSITTNYSSNPFIMLESKIHKLTSHPFHIQWVLRNTDRSGSVIQHQHSHPNSDRQLLPASDFPELLLKTNWNDAELSKLTTDYTHWLSPRLLTLHHLSRNTRAMLENYAQRQSNEVLRYHKNYPDIIDRQLINKTLVEAKLRNSAK